MSRIGKLPVKLANGVKVDLKGTLLTVKGPKGELKYSVPKGIVVKVDSSAVTVNRAEGKGKEVGNLHGLARTLIHNMVHGVSEGFTRELDIVGVGFRAAVKGDVLSMNLGFSHPVDYQLPKGVSAAVKGTHITLSGADKELVGQTAAKIRSFRQPEPYQGKGVKYTEEHIVRKQGKAAGAK